MIGRLVMAGGLFGLVGVVMVVQYTDRALNYVQVQARVDRVESECRLERTSFYVVARRREWTRDMDCALAKALLAEDDEMKGMHLKRESTVTVRYTSPADHQVHSGSYHFSSTDDRQPVPQAGGVIGIMAHMSNPDKIQRL